MTPPADGMPTAEALARARVIAVHALNRLIDAPPIYGANVDLIVAAMEEYAAERERATWEAAAQRFGTCATVSRERKEEVDSPGYWAREGAYRAYKHVEAACMEEARAYGGGVTK